MSPWSMFLSALIKFFAPLALKWLEDLFKNLEDKLGARTTDPMLAVHDVFTAARDQLWWWQIRRRRQLDAAQRVALRHAAAINAAEVGLGEPKVSGADVLAIRDAE